MISTLWKLTYSHKQLLQINNDASYKKKITFVFKCSLITPPDFMLSDNAAMIGWACLQKESVGLVPNLLFKVSCI